MRGCKIQTRRVFERRFSDAYRGPEEGQSLGPIEKIDPRIGRTTREGLADAPLEILREGLSIREVLNASNGRFSQKRRIVIEGVHTIPEGFTIEPFLDALTKRLDPVLHAPIHGLAETVRPSHHLRWQG